MSDDDLKEKMQERYQKGIKDPEKKSLEDFIDDPRDVLLHTKKETSAPFYQTEIFSSATREINFMDAPQLTTITFNSINISLNIFS